LSINLGYNPIINSNNKESNPHKTPYTIPCSSIFRDAVLKLGNDLGVNVADLARSVLLTIPTESINGFLDPGGPGADDREKVLIKSGPSAGQIWRRKPRLQARLRPGYHIKTVRRALNISLNLHSNDLTVKIETTAEEDSSEKFKQNLITDLERLQKIVSILSFEPLKGGVSTPAEALHVMGFAPSEKPRKADVRSRFRTLAAIHHPDGNYGDHNRMIQINAALSILTR